MATVSDDQEPKKLQPITVPKIIDQLEKALLNIKLNQSNENESIFENIDNLPEKNKNDSKQEFIGKELMLFEMIGVMNGKISDLQKKYDKIKSIEEREQEFISEQADSITQPIQDIIDYAKLAKSGHMKHEEAWDNVLDISQRLQNITTSVLDTNRVENNSLKIFTKNENMNRIILECVESVREQSVNVSINVGLDHEIEIPVDRLRISQVLKTILKNGIEHTEDGLMKVESFVAHDQNLFIIRIFDIGKGIPEDKIELIFEPKKDEKNLNDAMSSKLSLYLCKGIIQAHGGQIFAKNNAGKGCIFTITLPLK